MLKRIILFLFFSTFYAYIFGQGSFNLVNTNKDKIKFELINNLVVIPVEVNGVKLSFLLDSGVSKPILFNIINLSDSLQINNVETVYLRGLGSEGAIEALRSKKNILKIGKAINVNQEVYVVFDESINFAPRLGVPIHGIIGYDIFKDLIVELNYSSKTLKLYDPAKYKYRNCKKCRTFDLTLSQNKPYIDAVIEIDSIEKPVKLLIDSGGSDALWLFEDEEKDIKPIDSQFFEDYLGKGLSGSVYGKRSKIASFSLQDFKFKNVNVAFPDSSSITIARKFKDRSGSISGELLKRFNIIFDYGHEKVTFRKNHHFNEPFHYNKSGIVLEQHGIRIVRESNDNSIFKNPAENNDLTKAIFQASFRYSLKPAFTVVELRKGSPAEKAGLMIDDVILSVNNKNTASLKMHEIINIFSDEDGKMIRIRVDRNGFELNFEFKLESPF
ncbi:aspartyl protease family protein [Subsaxibacter sp. CAU 1640]|uniref:pepsin/retropepsin-like aspartic protease family protein n=1 Tax=Subsaxibacter sp. CAU 1640 TaxID=2933271 RepID=UPI002002E2D9|nr:aspartyl protease family protein [Subsaxibacter sp. CAU 1640]MCK7590142.1 aspartyl protease family protein [Subsaxibacter sp. CAU 1640]